MEKSTSRLKILAILVAFMFAALSTRLWFLQVLSSASAGDVIEQQSTRIVKVDAVRGDIFDDQGRKIVDNRISLEVRVNKQELGDDAEAELLRLSDVLGIPVQRHPRTPWTTRTTSTTSPSRSRSTSTRTWPST